jgi:hypothetical protein
LVQEFAKHREDWLGFQIENAKLREERMVHLQDISYLKNQVSGFDEVQEKLKRDVEVRDLALATFQNERDLLSKELDKHQQLVLDLQLSRSRSKEQVASQDSGAQANNVRTALEHCELEQEVLRLSDRLLERDTECKVLRQELKAREQLVLDLEAQLEGDLNDGKMDPEIKSCEAMYPSPQESSPTSITLSWAGSAELIEGDLTLEDFVYSRAEQAEMRVKGQKFTSVFGKEVVMNSSLCADQDSSDNVTEQSPLLWAENLTLPQSSVPFGHNVAREGGSKTERK